MIEFSKRRHNYTLYRVPRRWADNRKDALRRRKALLPKLFVVDIGPPVVIRNRNRNFNHLLVR
jgi:hypothetical protein